jgi:hypothetical protein
MRISVSVEYQLPMPRPPMSRVPTALTSSTLPGLIPGILPSAGGTLASGAELAGGVLLGAVLLGGVLLGWVLEGGVLLGWLFCP